MQTLLKSGRQCSDGTDQPCYPDRKDINSTSSSVTNLNNKVDAISVGGTNLIKNSGDMTGWSSVVSDTYRGNAVIGATVKPAPVTGSAGNHA